jgi:hypothetical protein
MSHPPLRAHARSAAEGFHPGIKKASQGEAEGDPKIFFPTATDVCLIVSGPQPPLEYTPKVYVAAAASAILFGDSNAEAAPQ